MPSVWRAHNHQMPLVPLLFVWADIYWNIQLCQFRFINGIRENGHVVGFFYFVQYLIDVRNYSISCRASGEHSRVLHLSIQRETHLTYRKQPSRWVCLCVHYAYHIRTYKPLHLPIFIQEAMPLNNHDNSISQQIESLCIGQSTRKKNGTVFWCKNSAIVNIDRYRKTFSRYWHVRTFVCKIQIYGVKQSDDGDGGGG